MIDLQEWSEEIYHLHVTLKPRRKVITSEFPCVPLTEPRDAWDADLERKVRHLLSRMVCGEIVWFDRVRIQRSDAHSKQTFYLGRGKVLCSVDEAVKVLVSDEWPEGDNNG